MLLLEVFSDLLTEKVHMVELNWIEIPVWENPNHTQFIKLLDSVEEVRGFLDQDDNVFIWDGYAAIHRQMQYALNIDSKEEFILKRTANGDIINRYPDWSNRLINNPNYRRMLYGSLNKPLTERIDMVDTGSKNIPVFENPSHQQVSNLLDHIKAKNPKFTPELRGIVDEDGRVFIWDAALAIHDTIISHHWMIPDRGTEFYLQKRNDKIFSTITVPKRVAENPNFKRIVAP